MAKPKGLTALLTGALVGLALAGCSPQVERIPNLEPARTGRPGLMVDFMPSLSIEETNCLERYKKLDKADRKRAFSDPSFYFHKQLEENPLVRTYIQAYLLED
jgi:hypothetical protein